MNKLVNKKFNSHIYFLIYFKLTTHTLGIRKLFSRIKAAPIGEY